jgi:Bacterial Ig domain
VNIGVAVVAQSPNSLLDPFFLGSRDENDVTGYTGTPVNVNSYLFHYRADVQTAGLQYPLQGQYYVAVDSGHSEFDGRSFAGRYLLHAWVNDVNPPLAMMLTTTVSAGRPTLVARTIDLQSGVDPLSLVIAYGRVLVGAVAYDPVSGLAVFPLPSSVPALRAGRTPIVLASGDFQEDKNVDQAGAVESILPNTAFVAGRLKIVNRPTVQWLAPEARVCVAARTRLVAVAGSPRRTSRVRFSVDGRPVATDRSADAGLYMADWRAAGLARGSHRLLAQVTDAAGRTASAVRTVRLCAKS